MQTHINVVGQQKAIVDTKQLIQYIKPISVHDYWHAVVKDPRFPAPVVGGNGSKALHSLSAIDAFLEEAARTGFLTPEGKPYVRKSARQSAQGRAAA